MLAWRLTRPAPGVAMLAALAAVAALASCGLFERPAGPTTFYVSPSGDDSAAGTSPGTAWRTLARADAAILRPGDRLLLEGGKRFAGQLWLGRADAGNPRKPVVVGSYGTGRATIVAARGSAVVVADTAGVDIGDLVVVSRRLGGPDSAGIVLFNDLAAGRRLARVIVDGVDISGFADGILLAAVHQGSGFRDVRIANSALHHNSDAGLASYGPPFDPAAPSYAHADIVVTGVRAFDNRGDPASRRNTGNGIVLGSVAGAEVSWSTAYGNGGANRAPHEGPIGIWAYDSAGVLIDHDLAYGNQTASGRDGGGFGLDENTTGCRLEHNLSYGNAGAGYQVYSPANGLNAGSVVRYNISSGDARSTVNAAGIIAAGRVVGAQIYQNTVVVGPSPGIPHAALWVGAVRGVTVRDNVFLAERPGPIVISMQPLAPAAALLQGNDYFNAAAPWTVLWGLSSQYRSLAAWRASTGQERVRGKPAGLSADPRLAGPVLGLTADSATDPRNGAGFVPLAGSPVTGAALRFAALPPANGAASLNIGAR